MQKEEITKRVVLSLQDTFKKMGWGEILFHPSYWSENGVLISDYHSKIDFGGECSGFLCLSLSEDLVLELLKGLKVPISKKYMLDITSEISNIVAGNIGQVLGKGFSISVPVQLENNLLENKDLLHIPIEYKNCLGVLVVNISAQM